jgi:hypothetical protein
MRHLSERSAWLALVLLLGVGVPLFLRMPLETDVTHYDLAARALLRGGVHYRDTFDTNLPGMVWLHAGVRSLLGFGSEAIRGCDLLVVAAVVWLLTRWVRPPGEGRDVRVWTAVALFAFYFSTTEWCHCQRDTWMLLPALIALGLRHRQTTRLASAPGTTVEVPSPAWPRAAWAVAEGLCWAAAVWIKPFAIVPGFGCWLVSAVLVKRSNPRWRRLLAADAAGLLAGGLLAGAAGTAWLCGTGAWPYFLDVLVSWNPEYVAYNRAHMWTVERLGGLVARLFPWSLIHLAAVSVALVMLRDGLTVVRSRASEAAPSDGGRQPLLAAFYVGWLFQAVVLQNLLDYIHVPPVLLGLTVLAAWPWRFRRRRVGWLFLGVFAAVALARHPLVNGQRVRLWTECWREPGSPELQARLALENAVDWENLRRAADYLRGCELQDGEMTCFNAYTIPVYVELDLQPSTRYLYLDNTLIIYRRHREAIRAALAASRQRYVLTDLCILGLTPRQAAAVGADGPLALPPEFPTAVKELYPWSGTVVFRAGRYCVYRVETSPDEVWPRE